MATEEWTSTKNVNQLTVKEMVIRLGEIGGFPTGDFLLQSGERTPLYVNLRKIVSHPSLLMSIAHAMLRKIKEAGVQYDLLVGVPMTALPIATMMSVLDNCGMIMRRKHAKDHGTGKLLEGNYSPGQRVLIVEDVVASGASVIETIITLRREGLVVNDVVLVLERQPYGIKTLTDLGIKVHSLVTFADALNYLVEDGRFLTAEKRDEALEWDKKRPVPLDPKLVEQLKAIPV